MTGTSNRIRLTHDAKGFVEITLIAEFPFDQHTHGWIALQGIESRCGEVSTGEVTGGRLAELLITGREIKNVVHHLEGQTQLASIAVERFQLRLGATTENPSSTSAVGNQRRGFAVTLFQVGLEGLARVVTEQTLLHLTISQIHDHAAEQFHHIEIIEIGEVPAGLREQKITSQNGHTVIETTVNRFDATPGCGFIHDVIVNQRGCMDHLGDLCQAAMPGCEPTVTGKSS